MKKQKLDTDRKFNKLERQIEKEFEIKDFAIETEVTSSFSIFKFNKLVWFCVECILFISFTYIFTDLASCIERSLVSSWFDVVLLGFFFFFKVCLPFGAPHISFTGSEKKKHNELCVFINSNHLYVHQCSFTIGHENIHRSFSEKKEEKNDAFNRKMRSEEKWKKKLYKCRIGYINN